MSIDAWNNLFFNIFDLGAHQVPLSEVFKARPDTRHKMNLVCILFTFENNTGQTDRRTDGPTSYRDATVHLEINAK